MCVVAAFSVPAKNSFRVSGPKVCSSPRLNVGFGIVFRAQWQKVFFASTGYWCDKESDSAALRLRYPTAPRWGPYKQMTAGLRPYGFSAAVRK